MSKHKIPASLALSATAFSLALAAPAMAQQQSGSQAQSGSERSAQQQRQPQQQATSQGARESARKNPYARADNTWITLSGTVESVGPNSFELSYGDGGDGRITVEMDDDDRDADGYALRNGDEVTVSGRVDDDSFASTSIEASSVYVEKLGTYFFASSADEEDFPMVVATMETDPSATWVVGTVTGVGANEFVLDRGVRSITVEVEDMAYDPLDDEGYQRIEIGDVVSIAGNIDHDFFEGRELEARAIVTLFDHPG